MRTHIRFSVSILAAVCSLNAQADWESSLLPNDFAHQNSLKKAVAEAKRTDKHVILYYTRTNCPPCEVLQRELRSEPTASLYRDRYVFTAVWGSSMGETERKHYRGRYNVQGAPTWLVFTNEGEYLCTAQGGFRSSTGAKQLQEAAQNLLKAEGSRGSEVARSCT